MLRRFLLSLAVAAIALTASHAATAAEDVSGAYAIEDFGSLTCAPVGGSAFLFRCETIGLVASYSGSLTGTSTANFEEIINCQAGTTVGHGLETFTGSVAGVGSGTLTWGIHFSSAFDCATFTVSDFVGRAAITSGTGELASLRGLLRFDDDSYEGELH
jgi:hypothetical protein